jgi:predicted metalloprotease with PDZ domain
MNSYDLSNENANQQYLLIKAEFVANNDNQLLNLPSWRPGRYELGNFAKNIKNLRVFDENKKRISISKIDLHTWQLRLKKGQKYHVEYSYYAAELNAGSTFVSNELLYVNPINCFVYQPENLNQEHTVSVKISQNWEMVCGIEHLDNQFVAKTFHELVDSPFILSAHLNYSSYFVNETEFVICFNGIKDIPWKKVIADFKAFTEIQISKFIEFPVNKFFFFIHTLPYKAYHGVEHLTSTVITLGPSHAVFSDLYSELLGVCSHELYHVWNVKSIRPIEMFPYDYQKENFSRLGFLCEGITTYMGDLMLLKSGVFQLADYFKEFNKQLQKHFDNPGRFNYSLADSSFDTWLDGYAAGAPARKVSIYTEGCLIAFVLDVKIRVFSSGKYGIDELMKRFYFNYALAGKGVSEEDFKSELEKIGGSNTIEVLENYVYGTNPFESILMEGCEAIGLELRHVPSSLPSHADLGFKSIFNGNYHQIKTIFTGGPADTGGLMIDDQIVSVNNYVVENDLEHWLGYFGSELKTVHVIRHGKLLQFNLPEVQRTFYNEYSLSEVSNKNHQQQKLFDGWIS